MRQHQCRKDVAVAGSEAVNVLRVKALSLQALVKKLLICLQMLGVRGVHHFDLCSRITEAFGLARDRLQLIEARIVAEELRFEEAQLRRAVLDSLAADLPLPLHFHAASFRSRLAAARQHASALELEGLRIKQNALLPLTSIKDPRIKSQKTKIKR